MQDEATYNPEATHIHVAVFDPTTGYIRQVVWTHLRDATQQHLAHPGHDFTEVPDGTNPRDHMIDPKTKKVVPRVAKTEEIAAKAKDKVRIEVADAITGGFVSNALGAPREYPSNPTDQANMVHASITGGLLKTCFEGKWGLETHTAEQAKKVLADFVEHKDHHRLVLHNS
jgi:hypothetical protein